MYVPFEGFSDEKGQVDYSYKSLMISMSTCMLILLAFVLIHILVQTDFQAMFPIYIMMGPSLAIVEIASLVALINNICDTDKILENTTVTVKSRGIGALKQFLCHSKGSANVLVTLIVIISISLTNYASTSISKYTEQKSNISEASLLSSSHVHRESNNEMMFNNSLHMNSIFVGIDHVINANQPKQELSSSSTNPKYETSNGTDSNNSSSTYLRLKRKSKMNTKDFADQTQSTAIGINSNLPIMHRKNRVVVPKTLNSDNKLKVVNKTRTTPQTNNIRHLSTERQFNLSTNSKNISWHHVLPIWKKVMHNLATKMETNENKEKEETERKAVIKTWKNTLLGILAIILFSALFLQLSLLITTFTTITVF